MTSRLRYLPGLCLGLFVLLPVLWPESAQEALVQEASAQEVSVAEPALRYPFDPVCPWGRVADGRGLLVRCLDAAEARRLGAARSSAPAASPAPAAAAPVTAPPAAPPRSAEPPSLAATAAHGSSRRIGLAAISAARADTGELPEARPQLLRASQRYVACVESNGGLSASPARVTLRFLVRERGRAEGVTVKAREGLSLAAAKCIAEVVDRRFVGYPAAPIVGADLSVEFAWEGAGR